MLYANASGAHANQRDRQIQSSKAQAWFNCEYFYSQMDKAYFAFNSFERHLQNCGVGAALLTTKEWAVVRLALRRQLSGATDYQKRRFIFSEEFVRKERQELHEFRSIFRDIINLMSQRKELISYIFTGPDDDSQHMQAPLIGF
jgi:hypothetical protein